MPKRISTEKRPRKPTDFSQLAFQLMKESTEKREAGAIPERTGVSKAISRVMAQMGSRGGKIGGKRRLVSMTPEPRSQVASDAAKARWKKRRDASSGVPETELNATLG
jgi:hypothetical protein